MIDPDSVVTLPNGASFEDADISLGALPEISPENAVALLTYSYNDRVVGTAYLLAKDGVTIDSDDSAADAPSSTDISTPSEPSAGADTDTPRPARSNFSLAGVLVTILIVLLVLAVISWLIYSKKKEARALAERRERRRQRLQRSGDEEEFERLLSEYKNKTRKK
mgnify:CR=1 FL=1